MTVSAKITVSIPEESYGKLKDLIKECNYSSSFCQTNAPKNLQFSAKGKND